jgi:hypothetical protein
MGGAWWHLPGPGEFVNRTAEGLRDGRNVILALPQHLPLGLEAAVRACVEVGLSTGGPEWNGYSAEGPDGLPPARQLFTRFAPSAPAAELRSASALCRQEEFGGKVIWVRGLTEDNWPAWRDFLRNYAHVSRTVPQFHRTLIVAPLMGRVALAAPEEDVALGVQRYHGCVDPLDMQVYTHVLLRRRRLPPRQFALATAVITELSLWDPAVSDRLVQQPLEGIVRWRDCAWARELAQERGWGAHEGDPEKGWAEGKCDRVGGRLRWHAAALPEAARERELERRVWAAQVRVLLPLVEQQRQECIERFAGVLKGPFVFADGSCVEDAHDLEIGQLEWQLSRQGLAVPAFVRTLKKIRNQLAHLEPLEGELLQSEVLRDPEG